MSYRLASKTDEMFLQEHFETHVKLLIPILGHPKQTEGILLRTTRLRPGSNRSYRDSELREMFLQEHFVISSAPSRTHIIAIGWHKRKD